MEIFPVGQKEFLMFVQNQINNGIKKGNGFFHYLLVYIIYNFLFTAFSRSSTNFKIASFVPSIPNSELFKQKS